MKLVEPEVYVLASTYLDEEAIADYFRDTYTEELATKFRDKLVKRPPDNPDSSTGDGQDLIEFLGRLCYRSFIPGLNQNVKKVREDQKGYFANIIQSKHGSILEHVSVTFLFKNVSRVFTHELVRHRAGTAISQESLRYVRLDQDLAMVLPPELLALGEPIEEAKAFIQGVETLQAYLANMYQLDSLPFHEKKRLTSAFRRLAPIGLATNIGWTANLRTLYHVIPLRTDPSAEWEIRKVFDKVGEIVKEMYPSVFQFMRRESNGSWVTDYPKV